MKKTRVWPALLAALVILAGCAAAPPEESDPPTEEFVFTRENMPRLNGSTSAVPWREAVCSVLLGESREEVADLVQFSRTTASYEALMAGEADLLLAGEPEQAVMERLEAGDRWLLTPFATDALVFVVNADNPVDGLTTEQLQKIYTEEITNWSQVGGEDRDIIPFQRNPEAGSQALMKKLVMDGLEMMEPPVDYTAGSMSPLLEGVRQYDNSPAAIGYTVYYYAHDMEMAQGLKLLSIDGTAPSPDTIRSGEYPFLNPLLRCHGQGRGGRTAPPASLYDWLLGEEGQSLVAQGGLCVHSGTGGVNMRGAARPGSWPWCCWRGAPPAPAAEPPEEPEVRVRTHWEALETRAGSLPDVETPWPGGIGEDLIPGEDYGPPYPYAGTVINAAEWEGLPFAMIV